MLFADACATGGLVTAAFATALAVCDAWRAAPITTATQRTPTIHANVFFPMVLVTVFTSFLKRTDPFERIDFFSTDVLLSGGSFRASARPTEQMGCPGE